MAKFDDILNADIERFGGGNTAPASVGTPDVGVDDTDDSKDFMPEEKPMIKPDRSGFMGGLEDMAIGVVAGARDGIQENIELAKMGANVFGADLGEEDLKLPEIETYTMAGDISRKVAQFGIGMLGAGKVMKVAGITSKLASMGKAGIVANEVIKDFGGSMLAFGGKEDRLADVIDDVPELLQPLHEYLQSDPNDTEMEGRFKGALEGTILGTATMAGAKAIFKAGAKLRRAEIFASKVGTQEALEAVQEATEELADAIGGKPADAVADGVAGATNQAKDVVVSKEMTSEVAKNLQAKIKIVGEDTANFSDSVREAMKASDGIALSKDEVKGLASEYAQKKMLERSAKKIGFEQVTETAESLAKDFGVDSTDLLGVARAQGRNTAEGLEKAIYELEFQKNVYTGSVKALSDMRDGLIVKYGEDDFKAMMLGKKEIADDVKAYIKNEKASTGLYNNIIESQGMLGRGLNEQKRFGNTIKLYDEAGEKSAEVMKLTEQEVAERNMFIKMQNLAVKEGSDSALLKIASEYDTAKQYKDMATKVYLSSLLSGLRTGASMAVSNVFKALDQTASMYVGSRNMDELRMANQYLVGQFESSLDLFKTIRMSLKSKDGLFDSLSENVSRADVFSKENKLARLQKEYAVNNPDAPFMSKDMFTDRLTSVDHIKDVFGKVLNIPFKVAQTIDDVGRSIADRATVRASLYEEATKKFGGDNIDAITKYVNDNLDKALKDNWFSETRGVVQKDASFTRDLTGFNKKLGDTINSSFIVKTVVPFYKTPVNIVSDAMAHMPLASKLIKSHSEDLASGGVRAQLARGKETLGTSAIVPFILMANAGMITGSAPKDPKLHEAYERNGFKPYSVKIGDTYYGYDKFDTFGILLGSIADYVSASRANGGLNQGLSASATAIALSVQNNILSKSYVRGLSDVLTAITSDPSDGGKLANASYRTATSFIPFSSLMRGIRQEVDPNMREVRSFLDTVMNTIPGYSDQLPARYDFISGQPKLYQDYYGPDILSPIGMKEKGNDEVYREVAKIGGIESPSKAFRGKVEMTPQQYARYNELVGTVEYQGKTLRDKLGEVINTAGYDKDRQKFIDDENGSGIRRDILNKVISVYKNIAERQMISEFPELKEEYNAQYRDDIMVKVGKYTKNDALKSQERKRDYKNSANGDGEEKQSGLESGIKSLSSQF